MYATANLYSKYRNDAVNTAGPIDLIIMLYDGCIKELRLAALHQEDGNIEERGIAIGRAQDIIDELLRSLDLSVPISHDLMRLYDFMLEELTQAHLTQDMQRLTPVVDMLTELRDAWKQAKVIIGSKMYFAED